jgi:hypothetical protein
MIKLEETIKMRADTEGEAQKIIGDYREGQSKGYILKKASYEKKEKKSKGEVIGEGYLVTITLVYADFWCMEG